ncbi:MAG: PxKF domain-containing protein [Armatimonadota bacterium]
MFNRFFTHLLSGAVLLLLLVVAPVRAMEFAVSTVDELVATVAQANANGEADTITLIGDPTLTLTAPLEITSDLTIVGPGTLNGDEIYTLMLLTDAAFTLDNLTFRECTTSRAVVAANNATLAITRCTFVDCIANGGEGFYGGAITSYYSDVTLTDSTFTGNTTNMAAGAVVMQFGSLTASGCTFTANVSPLEDTWDGNAGAITAAACPLTLTDSTFSANTSMGMGGAVSCMSGYASLNGCTFTENSASHFGGAVAVSGPGMEATGCTFTGNTAWVVGGALYYSEEDDEFDDFETDYLMELSDCVFHDNSVEGKIIPDMFEAIAGGGAVFAVGDAVAFNCLFTNNRVRFMLATDEMTIETSGGAVLSLGMFAAMNCAFSVNSVTSVNDSSFGGAQAIGGAIGTFENWYYDLWAFNCTFSGNSATASATGPEMASAVGGGIALAGRATLANSILWGNLANGAPDQATFIPGDWFYPDVSFCNIQGGEWAGTGNIDADPAFVRDPAPGEDGAWGTADDDPGNLALKAGSPCIDMGNNAFFDPEFLSYDLAGNPRVVNEIIDMGAYEFQGTAADATPPVITTPGNLTATATSPGGAVVNFTVTAEDDVDGPITPTVAPPSGSTFPLSTTTVNCTATDAAGNTATESFTVTVTYNWSGFLQPIEPPDALGISPSVFKAGSTVPVKFALTGDSAGITTATAKITYAKISNSVVGSQIEATSTTAVTTGNLFRYDPATSLYIFNWSTKGLTPGMYQIYIDLGDGVTRVVIISLK